MIAHFTAQLKRLGGCALLTLALALFCTALGVSATHAQQDPFSGLTKILRQAATPSQQQSVTADDSDSSYIRRALNFALETKRSGTETTWENPSTGHRGTVIPSPAFKTSTGQVCRGFERTTVVGTTVAKYKGTACREPNGSWNVTEERLVSPTTTAQAPVSDAGPYQPTTKVTEGLTLETQRLLTQLGFDPGPVDGAMGPRTKSAIEAFQRQQGLPVDGQVSNELVSRLRTAAATTPATAKTPVPMILVIDGFDPGVYDPTGLFSKSPGRVDSYLMPKIKTSWAEFWDLQEWKNLDQVIWGGDPTSTALAVGTARVSIQQLLYKKSETQPLVIVTHSWGSVIAYRALIDLSEQGILKPGDVDTFISMGSPLNARSKILRAFTRRLYQWSDPAPAANAVQQWRNYYIEPADKISGPIPGTHANVSNIAVPFTGPADDLWTAHSAYHEESRFLRQIGIELRNTLAARAPVLAESPSAGSSVTPQPQTRFIKQGTPDQQTLLPAPTRPQSYETSATTPACTIERSKNVPKTKASGDYERGLEAYEKGDYTTAYKLWLPLANNGDVRAQTMIGELYKHAWGVEFNAREAERWLLMAAGQGYPEGQYNLGDLYVGGWGVKDCNKGMAWLRKAANQGHSKARLLLAYIYASGRKSGWMCVPRDNVQAYVQGTLAAEGEDNETAQQARGFLKRLEAMRLITPVQIAQAKEQVRLLEQKISQTQSAQAQESPSSGQSDFYWAMTAFNRKDYTTAFNVLKPLAKSGDACAQHMLGFIYDKGLGVSTDEAKAREWYRMAAKQGDTEAAQRLTILTHRQAGATVDRVRQPPTQLKYAPCLSGVCLGKRPSEMRVRWIRNKHLDKRTRFYKNLLAGKRLKNVPRRNASIYARKLRRTREFVSDYMIGLSERDRNGLIPYLVLDFSADWISRSRVNFTRGLDRTALHLLDKVELFCRAFEFSAEFKSPSGYRTQVRFRTVPVPNTSRHQIVASGIYRRYPAVPEHRIKAWTRKFVAQFPSAQKNCGGRRRRGSVYNVCYEVHGRRPTLKLTLLQPSRSQIAKAFPNNPRCPRPAISIE